MKPVPNGPEDLGKNPANGVLVHYYFKEQPKGETTMEFLDAGGQVIKSYKSKMADTNAAEPATEMRAPQRGRKKEVVLPAQPGGNKFVWEDMRYPDPIPLEGAVTHGTARGPLAMPGTYQVRLTVDGKAYTQAFDIVKDPRIAATPEEFKEQFDLMINIWERINELRSAVIDIRKIRQGLEGGAQTATSKTTAKKDKSTQEVKDELLRIEDALTQFRAKASQDLTNHPVRLDTRFTVLFRFVESDDSKPTKQQHQMDEELSKSLAEQLKKLEALKQKFPDKEKSASE